MDMFSAANRDIYEKRKVMVVERWAEYEKNKTHYISLPYVVSYLYLIIHKLERKLRDCCWLIFTENWTI